MENVEINPKIIQWFEQKRKISEKTLRLTKIYSANQVLNGGSFKVEPHPQGGLIAFPYYLDGKVVNEKYRNAQKKFFQSTGGMRVFWNADALTDPRLQTDEAPLIITEGEIDCLTFLEIGCPAVSVPNGAVVPTDQDEDPGYIKATWSLLEPIKRIILAVDNDKAGKPFTKYLAQRLGEARCFTVTYPEGCKDANDVLQKHGEDAVRALVYEAKYYPISGIYSYSDLPPEPDLCPVTTGWGRLDPFIQLYHPSLVVVTGVANRGKSTFINQLIAQISILHGWKVAIASFEMRVRPFLTGALEAVYRRFQPKTDPNPWLDQNFWFILKEGEADAFDLDWVLDKAAVAVIRHGAKVLVIDPWNEVEHTYRKGETPTDYTNRAIMQIKKFAKDYSLLVILAAHITKQAANKNPEDLNLYDIADSAAFNNKADQGIVVARIPGSMESLVNVTRVRFQPHTGSLGKIYLTFDPQTMTLGE